MRNHHIAKSVKYASSTALLRCWRGGCSVRHGRGTSGSRSLCRKTEKLNNVPHSNSVFFRAESTCVPQRSQRTKPSGPVGCYGRSIEKQTGDLEKHGGRVSSRRSKHYIRKLLWALSDTI